MTEHVSGRLIAAYVAGEPTLPVDREWALESHLEQCAACRQRLADATVTLQPDLGGVLDAVWADIDTSVAPAPVRSRWPVTWASPSLLPWLAMTVLVVLAALGIDLAARAGVPSLVLLVAPIAPLLGVAAAWARGLDPMHELVVGTPRAGLWLVLRRTTAVLVVVLPPLAVAGVFTGASPALWLLPCLAFTLGTLALGTVVGVARAALVLGGLWVVGVVVPALATSSVPVVLAPAGLPGWAGAAVVAALVLWLRGRGFQTLEGETTWRGR